jgi:hypothetical protein
LDGLAQVLAAQSRQLDPLGGGDWPEGALEQIGVEVDSQRDQDGTPKSVVC